MITAAAAAAGRLVAGGYTVVFDGIVGPWFLDAFTAASGRASIHYLVLLPPERICLERVRSRPGHDFADLDAARHMHGQFAGGHVAERHVLEDVDDAEALASRILRLVEGGATVWPHIEPNAAPREDR